MRVAASCDTGVRVSLEGYYGAGNLGDDLLMLVTHSVASEVISPERIRVRAISPVRARAVLGSEHLVDAREPESESEGAVVLGGGGLFFDFRIGSWRGLVSQQLVRRLGAPWARRIFAARERPARKAASGSRQLPAAAFCIGIGPFTRGSRREAQVAITLSRFDVVIVRDAESARWCKRWRLTNPVIQATDAAFMYERWCVPLPSTNNGSDQCAHIGVVVRDWMLDHHGAGYWRPLQTAVDRLRSRGVQVRYVSFDEGHDRRVLDALASSEDVLRWNPEETSLSDFMKQFAAFDVVVTTRAHGAIVAACLNIPSVCVAIEPKLVQVHDMLVPTVALWPMPFDCDELVRRVLLLLDSGAEGRRVLRDTVARRQTEARSAALALQQWLQSL